MPYTKHSTPKLRFDKGFPQPFGSSLRKKGVNFSIFSKHATSLSLCLFNPHSQKPTYEIPLNPTINRTGDIWHILVHNLDLSFHYGFRIQGPHDEKAGLRFNEQFVLLDPYAKSVASSPEWGVRKKINNNPLYNKGILVLDDDFDWKDDQSPNIPLKDLIIYEMHVRGFTQDPSSKVKHKGTFSGICEKIPYLKSLGINAIELLPIHEFNELEFARKSPSSQKKLSNYWGYSTINFFTPMRRYSHDTSPLGPIHEFKLMVQELHKHGIEVILDVVFNHTSEGNEKGPTQSFRGLENSTYYILSPNGDYLNFSGCGNTMNCNHPVVRELIHHSLRYWVTEMHVDGFRFDLASILGRAVDGTPMSNPPLLEQISLDPLFAKTKLIAEAWDAAGLYQVGSFPSWGVWAEWNGQFRDVVRRFIKGTPRTVADFATRLCGSKDLYGNGRSPSHSINFVVSHDGFTLKDLTSYNHKHNMENGENNADGDNNNESWNCGREGVTTDKEILSLRNRQVRNLHLALMISQGVPMLHMGDEYCHSKLGNNNTWCHDNSLNWFQWNLIPKNKGFFRFYTKVIQLRKNTALFRSNDFLTDKDIEWHGFLPKTPLWDSDIPFIAFSLLDAKHSRSIYIAFNAYYKASKVTLPTCKTHIAWHRIVDTSLASPYDFQEQGKEKIILKKIYKMKPYSSIVLIQKNI